MHDEQSGDAVPLAEIAMLPRPSRLWPRYSPVGKATLRRNSVMREDRGGLQDRRAEIDRNFGFV